MRQPTSPGMAARPDELPGREAKRVWVLECHRAGDRAQSIGLAHALGWPFELKRITHTWFEFFPNMLIEATLLGVDRARSDPIAPPWPDLVISAGRRNENVAKWIRHRSGGRSRIVLVGRGWTRPSTVDLVIATPQYRLKPHPNLVINELPLHILDHREQAEAAARWTPRWVGLPRPWIAVLVGGSSGPYLFDAASAKRLGMEASAVARAVGGSLLVTTSSRTRPSVVPALRAALDAPSFLHEWRRGQEDNPYQGLLASADRFIVTGDSMSMLAEAAGTGKPLQIFEFGSGLAPMRGPWSAGLEPRAWMRWLRLLRQRPRAILNGLAIALPPVRVNRARDIRIVQDILIQSGRAVWLGEDIGRARPAPLQDMDRAVRRVRALFWSGTGAGASSESLQTVRKAITGAA
ncbi:MAG TPA: ELM1/GtrOC1 family putative glycosyltransferase [Alphaproteobacteria bacterium]|nr:ELM1/GtrOC1 family putative glycosyltransferase [Alphaproteobacteria bacterium]